MQVVFGEGRENSLLEGDQSRFQEEEYFFKEFSERWIRKKKENFCHVGNSIPRHRSRKTETFVIKIKTELTLYRKLTGLEPVGQILG